VISVEHEVLDHISDELVPWLRDNAAETEANRRLPVETAKRLRESGVMRLLQPKRVGGYEAAPQVFYEAVRRIGTACGSTAWVTGVVGVHAYQVALYFVDWDNQGRREAVEMMDAETLNLVAPVKVVKGFGGGCYLVYSYNKSVKFRFNKIRGDIVTLSGIFFDSGKM